MQSPSAVLLLGVVLLSGATAPPSDLPIVRPNANLQRAGVLRAGLLTVALEAKLGRWYLNGSNHPPMTIEVFAEPGKAPLLPGPFLRVPQGTEIRLSVRNSLPRPLTFFLPAELHGGVASARDSVVIPAGTVGLLSTRASVPGNYVYLGQTPNGASRVADEAGLLAGAIVVDSAGAPARAGDRVFVIMETLDSAFVAYADTADPKKPFNFEAGRFVFTINGRSWPNTERLTATVGDSLHWRVINASGDVHPMHLHGFYYRIDGMSGPFVDHYGRPSRGQMAVTQLMSPFAGMSMTWSPDRPGNWIFHCHFALHLMADSISAEPGDPHAMGMVGLVLGIAVTDRRGTRAVAAPPARRLRLVALTESSKDDRPLPRELPTMHFLLEENGQRTVAGGGISPVIDLTRGERVAITVVNHLAEPTSVHWHGIELEDSYVDGVPGVSGAGRHLAPEIAPGDLFVATFTPPRSGTFMYHAHLDEVVQQRSGLLGAIVVRDPGTTASPDEHVFFLKGARFGEAVRAPLEVNGQTLPDTVVLHAGRPARLRFLSLATANPVPWITLTARPDSSLAGVKDSMVEQWRPLAKDGADLPAAARSPCPARHMISIGETYDFEYTPSRPGTLRLEVRANRGRLLTRVPIRVE